MIANSQPQREPVDRTLRRMLSQIPTVFGQLVFLSSLRDPATGRYAHRLLEGVLGLEDADRSLLQCHYQVFSRWLAFRLEVQKDDLKEYLNSAGLSAAVLNYPDLIPRSSRDVERQLYLTDLETLVELLRLEGSAGSFPPGS